MANIVIISENTSKSGQLPIDSGIIKPIPQKILASFHNGNVVGVWEKFALFAEFEK